MDENVLGTDNITEDNVPTTDADIIKYVNTLFQQAKSYKRNYKEHITIDNLKWYKGEQWDKSKQLAAHEYIVSNRIFTTIENTIPILTDNKPSFSYLPTSPNDQAAADMMNKVIGEYLWFQMGMDLILPENAKNTLIYGTSFLRPYWDNEAYYGMGDIRVKVVSPFSIFPCPGYKELDEKIPHVIFADYVSIAEIRKRYPEGYRVETTGTRDEDIPDLGKSTNQFTEGTAQVTDTSGERTEQLPVTSSYGTRDERKVLLIELWVNDQDKQTYPHGRLITVSNNILLEDRGDDIPCKGPSIVKFLDMVMPTEFWGMGEIIQLKDPQRMINKFRSVFINILRYTSDPPLLVDKGAIDDDDLENYINEPGIIIEKTPGLDVGWMQMKMIDVGLVNYVQSAEDEIGKISGVTEWSPAKSGNLPSGKSIYQMQEVGQTRIRLKVRNMQASLQKMGLIISKILLKNYTEPRVMRVMGDEGEPLYVKVFREENPQLAMQMKMQIEQQGMKALNLVEVNPDFDLKVSIEPSMPMNKAAKFEIATELFKMGAIDTQALLDSVDYPEKEKIRARMQEAQQQAQQQQLAVETEKAMLEAKTKTAPKISLSGNVEDL